ncbi:MAG TPA: hypothetical protein VGK47_14415 [Nitrososphaeraceae archaeon]
MTFHGLIDQLIKDVCPIHGISFGILDDKNTWRIDFKDQATPAQRAVAQNLLINFDPVSPGTIEKIRKLKRNNKYKDNPLIQKEFKQYKLINPTASVSDFFDYLESQS